MPDIPVAAGSLGLTGDNVAVGMGQESELSSLGLITYAPSRGIGLILQGHAPSILGALTVLPSSAPLTFDTQIPSAEFDYFVDVAVGSLAFSTDAPAITTNHLTLPATYAVSLAGLVPVADPLDARVVNPARRALSFSVEAPLPLVGTSNLVGPPRGTAVFAGLAPTVDRTLNSFPSVGETTLTLSTSAPVAEQSQLRPVPGLSLTLTSYVPVRSVTTIALPLVASITFAPAAPTIFSTLAALTLATYAPAAVEGRVAAVGAGALTATGLAPETGDQIPDEATLVLASFAPTITLTSLFSDGKGDIVRLTTKYDLERFISIPSVETN